MTEATPPTKNILRQYLNRLTNLSASNRMLYMPRLIGSQSMDIHSLSQLMGEKSFAIIKDLIAEKKKAICPLVDARMASANEASQKLKQLQRLDHFLFEEHGSHDLHVGWPFVRGKFSDGTTVRCPLLLFPVEICRKEHEWVLQPRSDLKISFNKSFLLAYAHYHQWVIPEELMDEDFEEIDRDSTVFRTSIYQMMQKARLEVHFNADNFQDELVPFQSFTRPEFDQQHETGRLKLFPEACLGIFPRAGSYLVPDYQLLLEKNMTSVESLLEPKNPPEETLVKEENMHTVFPMDAWQEHALKQVKAGKSVVVQGPPGTGKSQLISNLVTDAMANGKRVLVVCQKRAALDVVYDRLKTQRLHPYLGLVHDFVEDRKRLFEQIAHQISRVDEYKLLNQQLDTVLLDRTFYKASRNITAIEEDLQEFKNALYDEKECGVSIKQLYLTSSIERPFINLKQEYTQWPATLHEGFLHSLKRYCHYASTFDTADHPWKIRKSFASYLPSDKKKLTDALKEVPLQFVRIYEPVRQLIGINLSWEDCERLSERKEIIQEMLNLIDSPERFTYFRQMLNESSEDTSALWLSNIERVITECYQSPGPEVSVASAHLGQFQEALTRSMKARRSIWGMIRWELFSKDKILITRALVSNALQNDKQGFLMLEQKLDNRLNLEHNLSKLKEKKWLVDLPSSYELLDFQHWSQDQLRAIEAKNHFQSLRELVHTLGTPPQNLESWRAYFLTMYQFITRIQEVKTEWLQFLTASQISKCLSTSDYIVHATHQLSNDFDALVEFDKMQEALSINERKLISRLHEFADTWDYVTVEDVFKNSIALAWIDHIETKHPVLSIVSSGKLDLMEQELRNHLQQKQKLSSEIVHLRIRERIIENLEYNRSNNRVTFRDLDHQVTKKRKIWPLRKVLSEFEDDVFRLLPCWLASPESVSAIFPMRQMFDLVIFDEASQCFAEHGIPAACRGRQIMVAGDRQQLKPGDLYQVRFQEETDDTPDLEIESLLDLCSRYLPQTSLRWHYRSESIPLIHFSNKYFYEGQLTLLPHRKTFLTDSPPIKFVKVQGIWSHQQNDVEAKMTTHLVLDCIKEQPEKSVGVVTFNSTQQTLIIDYLEAALAAEQIPWPENLFVKNIENVQGDERDIILFSIGYAPDEDGKVRAQFGSLNRAGGENRLNVAITRARHKIIVVSSLWPHEWALDNVRNQGPRLLKLFLQYAQQVSERNPEAGTYLPEISAGNSSLKTRLITLASHDRIEYNTQTLPHVDVTMTYGQTPLAILLTDDHEYGNSISPKERHATLPALLEAKEWKYHACYSRNYWSNPEKLRMEIFKLGNL
jgi:hypothetical protein